MMNKSNLCFMVLIALLCSSIPAWALKEQLDITDDERSVFHVESFGYEPDGVFRLLINDLSLLVPHDYVKPADGNYRLAFVLERSSSDASLRVNDLEPGQCFHETKAVDAIVISLASRADWKSFAFTKTIDEPGYYHLYFSNCEANTEVDFHLELEEYNVDAFGRKIYLSAGEASLPTWYFVISSIFVAQLVLWVVFLLRNKENVKAIHLLMTVVLVIKILHLFFTSLKYHQLKWHGEHSSIFVAYYIFSFLKGMMMFVVIVLLGTGWSYLKPFLTERDKQIILGVLVAQAMVNTAAVIMDETSPGYIGWLTWRDVLHLLDMVCCCVILLPIVWSIRHLRDAAGAESKEGKLAARNFSRLKSFRTFYLLVVSFVYFTRIIVLLLGSTLPFEYSWMANVFSEAASIMFYGFTGYLFRPQPRNPYLPVDNVDDEEDSLVRGNTIEVATL